LKDFLCEHPVGRELLADAQWLEGDVHWRKNLPYYSTTYAGDGFVLVGDAGAFIDPFYSPGMDWVAFTTIAARELIAAQRKGEMIEPLVEQHNRTFIRSYARWFEAVYKDKYEYMGDYDLMRLGFLLDLGLYYLGVAAQPFKRGYEGFLEPVFTTAPSVPFYKLMSLYGRRLAAIARTRHQRGSWGKHNSKERFLFGGYTFARASARHIIGALLGLAGTVLLFTGNGASFAPGQIPGLFAAFVAAFVWAAYSVMSRKLKAVPTDAVAGFCLVTALLAAIVHGFVEKTVWPETSTQWLAISALGVGPVGAAFFTWDIGMKRGDIRVLGAASYATPLLSTAFLILAGFAKPSAAIAIAAILIAGGGLIAAKDMVWRRNP